jgi:hypothetical protein
MKVGLQVMEEQEEVAMVVEVVDQLQVEQQEQLILVEEVVELDNLVLLLVVQVEKELLY